MDYAHECKYVRCDDKTCRALKDPGDSIAELKAAVAHWRTHQHLGGCSHGH
jgi:hypothetical protein